MSDKIEEQSIDDLGYLYFIHESDNYEKFNIGCTRDCPRIILKKLQEGNPTKLHFYKRKVIKGNLIGIFLEKIHEQLNYYLIRGEWYNISNTIVDKYYELNETLLVPYSSKKIYD